MRNTHRRNPTGVLAALLFIILSACGAPASPATNSTSTNADDH